MKRIFIVMFTAILFLTSSTGYAAESVDIYLQKQKLPATGTIINNSTLIPFRVIFEQLGAAVDWNNSTKTVTAIKDNITIQLTIGKDLAIKNGKLVELNTPAKIINAKTMVPLRFVSEAFGSIVEWDETTKTVFIDGKVNITNAYELKVIELTNKERAKYGLKPLKADWDLTEVARYKSLDMLNKNYFDHQSPTYGSPFDMMEQFGINYTAAGENIAAGYSTPESVVEGWMNSEGHRENILNGDFTHIGVGYEQGGYYRHYITQMFIRK